MSYSLGKTKHYFKPTITAVLPDELEPLQLTDREVELINLVICGNDGGPMTINEVAVLLDLSPQTVRNHLFNGAARKAAVSGMLELVLWYIDMALYIKLGIRLPQLLSSNFTKTLDKAI